MNTDFPIIPDPSDTTALALAMEGGAHPLAADRACAPTGLSRDASQAEPLVPCAVTHIRNGRAKLLPHVHGGGETWCGKKLIGKPECTDGETETFSVYGNVFAVTIDPAAGTCTHCRTAFDAAYAAAFPDGLKPIATFRLDVPGDGERAKAILSPEAMRGFFGPGGGGMQAFDAALREGMER